MHGSIATRYRRLVLGSAGALALTIAPYRIVLLGFVPAIDGAGAQAAMGGRGGGHNGGGGNGNGNGSGGRHGNGANCGGGGNSGGGNAGQDGKADPGSGGGNVGGGVSGSGRHHGDAGHVHVTTGDKIDVDSSEITVEHPDGITEKIENGRFRMQDAFGRIIIDRRATPADVRRLKAL